jgi:hypothetical protein
MNTDEHDQIRAAISKTLAETMKIGAETSKIIAEQRYYVPIAIGTLLVSALGACGAVIAMVVKLAL